MQSVSRAFNIHAAAEAICTRRRAHYNEKISLRLPELLLTKDYPLDPCWAGLLRACRL